MLKTEQKFNTLITICTFLFLNLFIFNIFFVSAQVFPLNNLLFESILISHLLTSGSFTPFESPFSLYTNDPYSSYDPGYSYNSSLSLLAVSSPFNNQGYFNPYTISDSYVYNPVSVLNSGNPWNSLSKLSILNPVSYNPFGLFNLLPIFY